jgi:hypothetical protein
MRRAFGLAVLVGFPGVAAATPWVVTGEAGAERDSNVQRVETGSTTNNEPEPAWVMRFGARIERKGKAVGGNFAFNLSDLTRLVADGGLAVENVAVLASNLRWLDQIGERPVAAGFALSAIDAIPLSDDVGARTFRNLGADALLAMRSEDEHELTIAFGFRDFVYKPGHLTVNGVPNQNVDWRGPAASVRLQLMLWQPAEKTKSLELVTTLTFENRGFEATALANTCAPEDPPGNCAAGTDIIRRDRYQRLGAELTWVGRQVAAVGYQITVIDSNDFGQSLARHRLTASGTAVLPRDIYGTLLAILQIDQYLDGRVVMGGPQMQEYTSIDDENRSSIQLRLARKLTGQWALEGRAAIWRNISGNSMELDFKRELVYLGLVYGK